MRARLIASICLGAQLALLGLPAARAEPPAHAADDRILSLIDQLRDDDRWTARMEAAVVLGRSGDVRARKPLLRALEDPHYAVRAAGVRALANLGDPSAIKPLLDRLGDDEAFVRSTAWRALGDFELEDAEPYLIHALKRHAVPNVRLAAAERLAESSSAPARRALLDAIGDDGDVGRFAAATLRALPKEEAIALFVQGLEEADYSVQIASIHALAEIGDPSAAEPLVRMLDAEVPDVTIAAAIGLRALAPHIDRSKWLVVAKRANSRFERARALKVIGILGGNDAALLILNALDDPDVLVRGAAVNGVASLGDRRAIPKLEEMKKEEANGRILSLVRTTLQRLRERGKSAS